MAGDVISGIGDVFEVGELGLLGSRGGTCRMLFLYIQKGYFIVLGIITVHQI